MPINNAKGKRQVAKPTKKQVGFSLGQQILTLIVRTANQVRDCVEKGNVRDDMTGQMTQIGCAPDDIKRSWSTEQLIAVEDFISTWASEPEPAAAPAPPPLTEKRTRQPRKRKQ